MQTGAITGHIDVALICLYAFWLFFFGLVVYLQRESRREGFPMAPDGILEQRARKGDTGLATPPRKLYRTLFEGMVYVPDRSRADDRPLAARPVSPAPGMPLVPTGNPLIDGIGPASWAPRVDLAERTAEGETKLVPMRSSNEHFIAVQDVDPRGFPVLAADGRIAGTVVDLWVDRSESLVRYLEVELSDRAGGTLLPGAPVVKSAPIGPEALATRVLLPMGFATINGARARIETNAILAAQFADVPRITDPSKVTLAEEDRVVAYFGGGALYATPQRAEPLL